MPPAPRQRAAKACQRCSKRKVKCDAAVIGSPCSRCRMDGCEDCTLTSSLRGRYPRTARHRRHGKAQSSRTTSEDAQPAPEDAVSGLSTSSAAQEDSSANQGNSSVEEIRSQLPPSEANAGMSGRSLAGLFEEFVDGHDHGGLGIVLFGEASPLTFALEENSGAKARVYDTRPTLTENKRLVDRPRGLHPAHCSAQDIAYLDAKGAFTPPEDETFKALFGAFVQKFHPLYTIVNKSELLEAYERKSLPWIMLHAICMIGATFCDASIIHRTSYKSRFNARQAYYGKPGASTQKTRCAFQQV